MAFAIPSDYATSVQTAEVYTGVFSTVNDAYIASPGVSQGAVGLTLGARNPLGRTVYSTDLTTGRRFKNKYVRLNSTTTATLIVGPVYYKDETFEVVTIQSSESQFGVNGIAGILLNVNATNGNYVYILTNGILAGVAVPASTAAGDCLIGAAGAQALARVAANTAPTNRKCAWALTAVASGVSDIYVEVDDLG